MGIGAIVVVSILVIWYLAFQIAEGSNREKRRKKFMKNMNEFDKGDKNGTR